MTTRKDAAKAATESTEKTASTKLKKALALTSEGIFLAMEKSVPKGATTIHVLEGAATLIGSSLAQMNATKDQLHDVIMHIEEHALKQMEKLKIED